MNKNNINKNQNLIVLLFSILPVVDSINGYLTYEGKSSIGTAYKLIIVLVLLFASFRNGKFSSKKLFNLIIFLCLISFSVVFNVFSGVKSDIRIDCITKLVFNVVIFLLLYENLRYGNNGGLVLYRIFNYNSVIMIMCIAIPYFLGIGYSSYVGDLGYKGFYYSLNELNAAQIILFYFCLYKLLYKLTLLSFLQTIAMFFCVILTNTKSSMLACGLGIVIWLICYFRRDNSKSKWVKILGLLLTAIVLSGFVDDQFATVIKRQETLYQNYGGSVFATLTSGRIYYLNDAWISFKNDSYSFIKFLFGNGFTTSHLIEMDLFDMFFFLGVIGVAFLISFTVLLMRKSNINFKKDRSPLRKLEFYIILAFSFFTGHVIFMATSGCYFALLCCFNLTFNKEHFKKFNDKFIIKNSTRQFNGRIANKKINKEC